MSSAKNDCKRTKKRSSKVDEVGAAILAKLVEDDKCDTEEHFGLHMASLLHTIPPTKRALT